MRNRLCAPLQVQKEDIPLAWASAVVAAARALLRSCCSFDSAVFSNWVAAATWAWLAHMAVRNCGHSITCH